MFSASSGSRGNFREADSFWVAAERFFRWSPQTSRGCETWLGDSCENVIRNYEIQITHTFSLGPAGALAADPLATHISVTDRRVPQPALREEFVRSNILGKCSRLLYAEFGGHEGFRHLRELGLGEYQARTYAWAKPVRVVPKQANRTQKKDAKQPRSSLTVPPIDVFGIPTDFGRTRVA